MAAAREIVAKQGLEALTFAALERRLAFTRGVITYHFRDKEEIVQALLDSALEEIDRAVLAEVQAARSLEEKIGAVLRGQVRGWLGHEEAGRILLSFWSRLNSDPRVARANAQLYSRYRARSAELVARASQDPKATAVLLVGTVIGIVCQAMFDPPAIDVEAAIEEAVQMFCARLGCSAC